MKLKTIFLLSFMQVVLPIFATASNYKCDFGISEQSSKNATGFVSGVTCRQHSKEMGLSSSNGSSPRNLFYAFNVNHFPNKINLFGQSIDTSFINGKYGILSREPEVVDGVNAVIIHTMAATLILSIIVYEILLNGGCSRFVKRMTTLSILIACSIGPYVYIDMMAVNHPAVRFMLVLPHFLLFFKTLEAYFGFTPTGVKKSFWTFQMYFSNAIEFEFDHKTSELVKSTSRDVIGSVWAVLYSVTVNIFLGSFMSAFGYKPFGHPEIGKFNTKFEFKDYLNPMHLGNCFFIAFVLQQGLLVGDSMFGLLMHTLYGYKTRQNMQSPLLHSSSPSDWWGRRWNLVVHGALKRGVYKPIRRNHSAAVASVTVFAASGILHEWIVHTALMYHRTGIPEDALYKPENIVFGSTLAFFLWNGVVIVIEKFLGRFKLLHSIGSSLPQPVVTFCIIMTALPFATWFADPHYQGRLFWDQEGLLWTIIKIDT